MDDRHSGRVLATELLFEEEIIAVGSPMLLAARRSPRTSEELADYTLLHDARSFWPGFIEETSRTARADLVQGDQFQPDVTRDRGRDRAGQGVVLANRDFVARDMSESRLIRILEGSLQGSIELGAGMASPSHVVRPRYGDRVDGRRGKEAMFMADAPLTLPGTG